MKIINRWRKVTALLAAGALLLGACNREFEDIGEAPTTPAPTGSSIGDIINNDTSYSSFKALLARAGAGAPALSNTSLRFTAFIPNNAAFRLSGIPSAAAVPLVFTVAQAIGITNYVVTPQSLPAEQIPTTFPNLQAPTLLNPTVGTPAFSPFVSLSIFPSRRANGAWVNNVPLAAVNVAASNGIIHNPAVIVAPPSTTLWSRISTDADMSLFRAAITRGDSGLVGPARIDSLLNLPIGPNFTVFAPTNAAFRALFPAGTPDANIIGALNTPALFPASTVRGLVVYQILGVRAFTPNFPTTETAVPTLLNGAIATHPGVRLSATFTGPFVTAATVKGAANATASNLIINPTPNPGGSSDQHFTNGVLHKIDQVLRPQ